MKKLVLGGCRSGKSAYAEQYAAANYQRKAYLATLEAGEDEEMRKRIFLHRESRGPDWQTIEEPIRILQAIHAAQATADVFVVDCITMWITNMICKGMEDDEVGQRVEELVHWLGAFPVPMVFVANEVGLGIVPESPLGRRFRDLAGWTNQKLAQACDEVVFVAAGLPLYLKKGPDSVEFQPGSGLS